MTRMAGLRVSPWWKQLSARHPQWWTLALSGLGWLLILSSGLSAAGPSVHHCHHDCSSDGMVAHTLAVPPWISDGIHSFAMAAAMMLPLAIPSVRVVAFRSLWARRHRAIAVFLVAYLACWVCASWLMARLVAPLRSTSNDNVWMWVAIALSAAAVWELTPIKRWGWRACHRTEPLPPRGWRATWGCLRFGCRQGCGCVASCGALMLAPALLGHSFVAMAAGTIACLLNRYRPEHRPVAAAGVLGACASVAMLLSIATRGSAAALFAG